jgi:hypothetical protein
MRRLLIVLAFSLSLPALAQNAERRPQGLEPLPEPPPPPPGVDLDAPLEPEVTIIEREGETVEEYRVGGRLYMIKVTPKGGPPFYLVDKLGNGSFSRMESVDSGVHPPMWVIHEF